MHFLTLISGLYGDLRGYRRLAIRRSVNNVNASAHDGRAAFAQMQELTADLLQKRVRAAIKDFPYYAEIVRKHRGSLPDTNEKIILDEFPVWTRKNQREFFNAQTRPEDAAYVHQTSGSTGLPVRFYVTRESYEWRTAVTDRSYGIAGAEEGRRSLYVWAADKTLPLAHKIKRKVHTTLQRRWFYDAFQQFGDAQCAECCAMIDRVRPLAIVGYTSLLIDLARYVRDHPDALRWKAKSLVNAAEGLEPGQRELIEATLADEVFLSYGSREFMNLGIECSRHDGYHVPTDNVLVEVVDENGKALGGGETGRIVITDLRNSATPFVRYEIGDYGTTGSPEPCACGLPFPRIASVDGRLQDRIYLPDGSHVTALYITWSLRAFDWIEGYQVVQQTRDRILVRILATEDATPERVAPVLERMRIKLGADIGIDIERVDTLERRATGKVALVISLVEGQE